MRHLSRKTLVLVVSVITIGVICVFLLPLAVKAFRQEGVVTLWIRHVFGTEEVPSAPPTMEPERPLDRTRPLAVMIDAHPNARPQSGIAKADVVWEAPVEGGLTRDMAIFRSASATEIGPVRSARPYFLEWASEANAVYAHVGGSDAALERLASDTLPVDDANEFSNGASFWRDSRRSAPHNTYTSSERLRELIEKKGWSATTDAVDATIRSDETASEAPADSLSVTAIVGSEPYEFRWDAAMEGYALWRRGRLARDRDGTPIVPRTVVTLDMQVQAVPDPQGKGLIGLKTIDSGRLALIFRNGVMTSGTWKKASAQDSTRIFDEEGHLIPFAEGQIWYAVVAGNRGGSVLVGTE